MAGLYSHYRVVTLKIMSRSLKFYQLFSYSMHCIYANLVKIHSLVQQITLRNPILHIIKCWCDLENYVKVRKGAKIRNLYNEVKHLTQDINGKVTNSQLETTNESQEVSPFPAGDHRTHINRRAQMHNTHKA